MSDLAVTDPDPEAPAPKPKRVRVRRCTAVLPLLSDNRISRVTIKCLLNQHAANVNHVHHAYIKMRDGTHKHFSVVWSDEGRAEFWDAV